jgi:hypothetical protein
MEFGARETIRCLQDVAQPGPKGEALCLANKFTVVSFVGPVGLTDNGYVLSVKGTKHYYPLSDAQIVELQASRALPTPLPSYALSKWDYVYGYLLWILIALMLPVVIGKGWMARRYRAALDSSGPAGNGPLVIKTEGDQFIVNQLALVLRSGERVSHQAFVRSDVVAGALISLGGKRHFAALTNERIILIETRGARLENHGVESLELSDVVGIGAGSNGHLPILLKGGTARSLQVNPKQRGFSNQVAFARDLPRLYPLNVADLEALKA